jgi:N-acetyl-beta-hexosaminidase
MEDQTWTADQAKFFLGGETALWGEGINEDNFDAYAFRGAGAAAERLWCDACCVFILPELNA